MGILLQRRRRYGYASPPLGCAVDLNHPLFPGQAWWPMAEGSGDVTHGIVLRNVHVSVVSETYGNTEGTFNGGTSWTSGPFGPAIHFNGSSGFVQTGFMLTRGVLNPSNYTISFWASSSVNGDGNNRPFGSADAASGTVGCGVIWGYAAANQLYFILRSFPSSFDIASVSASGLGTGWHHVAFTVSELDGAKAYYDGALIGTNSSAVETAISFGSNNYQVRMGRDANQSSGGFNGDMCNLKIFDRVLNQSDIVWDFGEPFAAAGPMLGKSFFLSSSQNVFIPYPPTLVQGIP